MIGVRDLGGDGNEVLQQRRADARHQAGQRQHCDGWRNRHQGLSQRHRDDLDQYQSALVDAIAERHEQHDPHKQAAEG